MVGTVVKVIHWVGEGEAQEGLEETGREKRVLQPIIKRTEADVPVVDIIMDESQHSLRTNLKACWGGGVCDAQCSTLFPVSEIYQY